MSGSIDRRRAELMRKNPKWHRQGNESEPEYAQRMMALCLRLSKGALRSVDPAKDAEAVAERAAIQAEADA